MAMSRILFRTDGGETKGLGHITRCVALAYMLKDFYQISFYSREIPELVRKQIQASGFDSFLINDEVEFLQQLSNFDIVVLDGYDFTPEFQVEIKERNVKLVCIDDTHNVKFYADLVINHTPGITSSDYEASSYTQFALGLDFTLLRPAFLEAANLERTDGNLTTIFICFGGSDINNLTQSTLSVILGFSQFSRIYIVTGPSYQYVDSLGAFIASRNDSRIIWYHAIDEKKMLSVMMLSAIAIVPCSGILLEALCVIPVIIAGMYANNQQLMYDNFKAGGYIIDALFFSKEDVAASVSRALVQSNLNNKLIDGRSGKRLLSKFLSLSMASRKVNSNDCALLYNWANTSDARRSAIKKDQIDWQEHKTWFDSRLNSPHTKIYIAEIGGFPIGQIRYDLRYDFWVISFYIVEKYRGYGLAKLLIEQTKKNFIDHDLHAYVSEHNLPSASVFQKSGFYIIGKSEVNAEIFNLYEYKGVESH
jgi:UDP-2,4-diacetamido-2,4,6-trideoxy-beta-L-altropyranose hydrolase